MTELNVQTASELVRRWRERADYYQGIANDESRQRATLIDRNAAKEKSFNWIRAADELEALYL